MEKLFRVQIEPLDFHVVLVLGLSLQRKKGLPFEIENGNYANMI